MPKTVKLTPKKEKPPRYELVADDDPAYRLLGKVREASHSTLEGVRLLLVWERAIKPDRDGHLVAGRCKKLPPLTQVILGVKEPPEFAILLNVDVWAQAPLEVKLAILDHELCHAGTYTTDKGEKKFYTRKHELEDFVEIAKRHGFWKATVADYAEAAAGLGQGDLFKIREKIEAATGEDLARIREKFVAIGALES